MVEINDDGWATLSKKPQKVVVARQKALKCFDLNASIYIWKRQALLECNELFLPKTTLYEMPACRSVDIDEELDMFVVEQILEGKWENWKGGPQ